MQCRRRQGLEKKETKGTLHYERETVTGIPIQDITASCLTLSNMQTTFEENTSTTAVSKLQSIRLTNEGVLGLPQDRSQRPNLTNRAFSVTLKQQYNSISRTAAHQQQHNSSNTSTAAARQLQRHNSDNSSSAPTPAPQQRQQQQRDNSSSAPTPAPQQRQQQQRDNSSSAPTPAPQQRQQQQQ
nr:RNA polymerase II degradation factor 1-like [Procambarus clarkii]